MHKILRDIIRAIELLKGYDADSWEILSEDLSKEVNQILFLLLSTDLNDDEIYNNAFDSSILSPATYTRKKNQLLNILSNVLVGNAQIYDKNKLRKDRYQVHMGFHCMSVLKDLNYVSSAIWYARNNIKQAQRLDMTVIVLDTSRYLYRHYSRIELNPKSAKKYSQIMKEYQSLLEAEMAIEALYNEVVNKQTDINALRRSLNTVIIPPYRSKYGSLSQFYIRHHGLLRTYRSEIQGKPEEILKEAHFYYSELEKKRFDHKVLKGMFLMRKIEAHLQLKQYVEAQQTIDLLFTKIDSSVPNWFDAMDFLIRLTLATQNYDAAYKHVTRLLNNKSYSALPNTKKDLYQIYAVYINFLVRTGHVQNASPWGKRRTTSYFRATTVFDRDTRGVRVAIIIAELVYNILDLEYDSIESKINSLKVYCSRYLKKNNENYRSNCFIRMLLEIPKANFNPIASRRKAAAYHHRLLNHPLEISRQPREVEIIPFEQLWHIIIHYLRSPKRARKNAMQLSAFNL
jgi:hypothetical protein